MAERYSKSVAKRTIGQLPRVQPVAERVDYSKSEMWKTVAQSAGQLSNQYYQYAQEDARHQAIINAEGYEFEKGPDGLTVMPPPMTEGGSIYQKNYQAIILNKYKRSIKNDIEGRLSEIHAKEFYQPEQMKDSLNNSLSATLEVVPEHMRDYVNNIGQAYVSEYYSRALKEQTRREFNATVDSLNQEKQDIFDRRVSSNMDIVESILLEKDFTDNITERRQLGILSEQGAFQEIELLNQFKNWDNMKNVVNGRDETTEGALLNPANHLYSLAQMFRGYEPFEKSDIEFITSDGEIIVYNKETIDKLFPDDSLKKSIANELEQRASYLSNINNQTQTQKDTEKVLSWFTLENNIGTHPEITGKAYDNAVNILFEQDLKNAGITSINDFKMELRNMGTAEAHVAIEKLFNKSKSTSSRLK